MNYLPHLPDPTIGKDPEPKLEMVTDYKGELVLESDCVYSANEGCYIKVFENGIERPSLIEEYVENNTVEWQDVWKEELYKELYTLIQIHKRGK